jgi:hypothetical protein
LFEDLSLFYVFGLMFCLREIGTKKMIVKSVLNF